MKSFEKIAVVLIVLWLISLIQSPLTMFLVGEKLIGAEQGVQLGGMLGTIASAHVLLSQVVNIAVGIWLFVVAKKNNRTPWIWLLFGLFFGLIAAVLYYLIEIHDALKTANKPGELKQI